MESYPLAGNHLSSLIGNGQQWCIGNDPWIGHMEVTKVSQPLIECLHVKNIF
jgi:hypothetical protein